MPVHRDTRKKRPMHMLRLPRLALLSAVCLLHLLAAGSGVSASRGLSVPMSTHLLNRVHPLLVQRASPAVSLSARTGPPTSTIGVKGAHFGSHEAVDVYFDSGDEALASTTGAGEFSLSIHVPASAVPGRHWVTAVGRHSALSAQVSFQVQTAWAQFGFVAQHTRTNPYENVLSPANVAHLDVNWSAATGAGVESSPAVVNGVVYVGSIDDHLYAFNAQTGVLLWSAATGDAIYSSPAVANGVVYVGSYDDHLYAFNAQTGVQLWSVATSSALFSSPVVVNGVIYISLLDDSFLYAFNARTGVLIWSAETRDSFSSSPAVANGVVYVGSFDGLLYAFNARTGVLIWSAAIGSHFFSTPAVVNGVVYVSAGMAFLYAFNARTGAQLWSVPNAQTGSRPWSAVSGADIESSPAVVDGVVYIGSSGDNRLDAYNAQTGARLWSAATGYEIQSSPAVANGVVYVGSYDDHLYALNARTGVQLWSAATGDVIISSPAVANGVVYVGSYDDHLYAYGLPPGHQDAQSGRPDPTSLHPNLRLSIQP